MRTVHLLTHATRQWLPRTAPYLESLCAHSPFRHTLLTVDCDAPAEFVERFPGLQAVRVPVVAGAPEYSASLQHGAFLDYVGGASDDVLIYTDADIIMQRAPSAAELARLEALPADHVLLGYNSGPGETLMDEAARLHPKFALPLLAAALGDLAAAPCYNAGVIAATRSTWRRLHQGYMESWNYAGERFGHPARQQWLICHTVARLGMTADISGYGWHANGHYGVPPGVDVSGTLAMYQGAPVLFRHRL